MSPDMKLDFESEWDDLQRRLRRFLFRKKVPSSRHDDIVQETALRLLLMWGQVDRTRSPWPLTVTIATNLLRDERRIRPVREVAGDLPERAAKVDVERSGLARVELEKVRDAMALLTTAQRAALLQEVGAAVGNGHSAEAEKMLRLRARRKLSSMLRDVSALVLLRYRRALDLLQGMLPSYEGLLPTGTCVICLLVGLSGGMVLETSTPAGAQQMRFERGLGTITLSPAVALTTASAPSGVDVASVTKPDVSSTAATATPDRGKVKSPQAGGGSTALVSGSEDTPITVPRTPPLPDPNDQPTDLNAEATIPEQPEPPSQEDGPVQLPVALPEAVTDPLDAGEGL
jgi:DNA-directed RNA polymerase specialized sigma24 family protein